MAKHSILIARFPYGASEHPKGTDWLVETVGRMKADERVGAVLHAAYDDTPITMTRNRACKDALRHGADYLLMLDSDLWPDYEAERPFWGSSFDFLVEHKAPAVIAAPYCGQPPEENIFVFRYRNRQSSHPDTAVDFALSQYTREEAAERAGIEQVAALPTGLILIDTRALRLLGPPWFYYQWTDETESEKASTEDVTFTRDCTFLGVPVYCNWQSWAGHVKRKTVGKPRVLTADMVARHVREARRVGKHSRERQVDLRRGANGQAVIV